MKTIEEKAHKYVDNLPFTPNYEEDNYDAGYIHGSEEAFIAGYEEANRWIPIAAFRDNMREGFILFKDEGSIEGKYQVEVLHNGFLSLAHPEEFYTHFRYIEYF